MKFLDSILGPAPDRDDGGHSSHTKQWASKSTTTLASLSSDSSMVCNDADTVNETVASSARSITSDSSSTRTKSSKSSKSRQEVTPGWVTAIDPLSMSTKSIGPGFLPSFSTHLYSPGFQAPAESVLGGSASSIKSSTASVKSGSSRESSASSMHARDLPLAFQQKQLVFKEIKKPGSKKGADSVSLSGSTKTSSTKGSGRPSEKNSVPPAPAPAPARPAAHTQTFDVFNLSSGAFLTPTTAKAGPTKANPYGKKPGPKGSPANSKASANNGSGRRPSTAPSTSTTVSHTPSTKSSQHSHQSQAPPIPTPTHPSQGQSQSSSFSSPSSTSAQAQRKASHSQQDDDGSHRQSSSLATAPTATDTIPANTITDPSDSSFQPSSPTSTTNFPSSTFMSQNSFMTAPQGLAQLVPSPSEIVSTLATKRSATWRYLQRVHQGGMAMYNTAILTEMELRTAFTEDKMQRRTLQYFLLGTSLATILEIPNTLDCIKALNTMLQEYEYFTASESRSKMNFFKASSRKATDGKSFEETGEYSHLEVRNIPFNMDYVITFATLCEMIAMVYEKLATESQWNLGNAEMVQKADARLKKILTLALKEIEALTREVVVQELNTIDPLGAIMYDWES